MEVLYQIYQDEMDTASVALLQTSLPTIIAGIKEFFAQIQPAYQGDISLLFCGDATIRELNERFRGKTVPTDVLSFPLLDLKDNEGWQEEMFEEELGDVIVNVDQALRQHSLWDHSPLEELFRLLVHGMLHLLGFDHEESREQAERMSALEIKYEKLIHI